MHHKKLKPDFSLFPASKEKIGGYAVVSDNDFGTQIEKHHLLLIPEIGLFSHAVDLLEAVHQVEMLEWLSSITLSLN